MPSAGPWQVADKSCRWFSDPSIPKLHNLVRAARAGLRVPPTVWAWAQAVADAGPIPLPAAPGGFHPLPCVVRSGSPTEDSAATSNAGQFLSVVVRSESGFPRAAGDVAASMPVKDGRRLGVVFVQPLIEGGRAGVTFFDGFYFEETSAAGGNQALTAGLERGDARRGHLMRGDRRHDWLRRVHRVFGGTLDLEWAEPDGGDPVLLQVRPALFPLRRCQTLSLANHKEILGDPPSPWMVSALAGVGRPVMAYFEAIDPATAAWEETYAVELGERAWLNFSAFFRLMDRWGLPRTLVTDGVGGEASGPDDARFLPGPFLRSVPVLVRLQVVNVRQVLGTRRLFRALGDDLAAARTLADLHGATARALARAIPTAFALGGMIAFFMRVRRAVGVRRGARVVTRGMMDEFAAVAARPDPAARLAGLDAWLVRYGHRGPFESDPARPRFAELRAALRADLERGPRPSRVAAEGPPGLTGRLVRPLFWADEAREAYRDGLMRHWQRLRGRILEEARRAVAAGHLDAPDDAFFLRAEDLAADPTTWRARAAEGKARVDAVRPIPLPSTAPRDAIEAALVRASFGPPGPGPDLFTGIGLGQSAVEGTAVRVSEVADVLRRAGLPESPVLVVDTLEPSWAVVFPRFAAVVAELGGELSHASILLREAGIPAVVNARGAYRTIAEGDLVRVDPARGEVRIEARR